MSLLDMFSAVRRRFSGSARPENRVTDSEDEYFRNLEKQCLDSCCENIQWLFERIEVQSGMMDIVGWAIFTKGPVVGKVDFLLSGKRFDEIQYPLDSPDLAKVFWNAPTAGKARFRLRNAIDADMFGDGPLCLEFVQEGDRNLSQRTAWYYPDPWSPVPVPAVNRRARVIGSEDATSFLVGGAAMYGRFGTHLNSKLGKSYQDLQPILDWGCGSGRVSRFLAENAGVSELWGADIDADNISWCQHNLPRGKYETIPLLPETGLPSDFFGLVIGISVFTHLDEEAQFKWLKELKRICRKDGILILSIQGQAQSGLYRTPGSVMDLVNRNGFVNLGRNTALDEVMGENDHYLDVVHSREYIHREWGKFFTVVDIVDAMAANQDAVILRNDLET